jgi:hypothetical protein
MDATSTHYRACCIAIGILIAGASGCCHPLAISGRFDAAALEPNCGIAEPEAIIDAEAVAGGYSDVAFARPALAWPHGLTRDGLRQHCAHFRANYLQPEPPPLKPPHARFHPLPTQPVFAARAEYAPPEALGAVAVPHSVATPPEELPLPIPSPAAAQPVWRSKSTIERPIPPTDNGSGPALIPPPSAQPLDNSRGSIAPTSFQLEPNPLRPASVFAR